MVLFGSTLTVADRARLSPAAVAIDTAAIISAITADMDHGTLARQRVEDAVGHVLAAKGMRCP